MDDKKVEQAEQSNSKDIVFKDLDESSFSVRPYLVFVGMYVFNAILILPIFLVKSTYQFFAMECRLISKGEYVNATIMFPCYLMDILMAISVLSMYPLSLLPLWKKDPVNFQYWAISCLIFLQSYILLQTYMQTIVKDRMSLTLQDLVGDENMLSLGLGRVTDSVRRRDGKQNNRQIEVWKEELYKTINDSLDEENIDPTLFFFTLENDTGIVNANDLREPSRDKVKELIGRAKRDLSSQQFLSEQQKREGGEDQEKRQQVLRLIRTQGFRGKRHIIDNLLWPHYQYIKMMQFVSPEKLFMIVVFVLVLKCSFPIYAIINGDKHVSTEVQFIVLGFFVGMYLNMISILIGLVINDDLKGKRYILNVLETLILQKSLEAEDADDDDNEFSNDSDDLPRNNKYKLDLSCNLSLESWDNARRLTIIFEQEKQDMYETTFSFLAIYLLYTYIILSQDFLGFDLFPSLHKFFKSPIQEWNMFIDFLLITLLFLTRVNEGSLYNQTFDRLQETIHKIASVYEDKKSLFDFYFSSTILYNIQNPTYMKITHSIYCTAAEKVLYGLAQKDLQTIPENQRFRHLVIEYSKQRVLQLCATMEKLVSQIEFDSEHFCHRFLGWFKSDITKVFSTFLILLYIFFHSKIKHYLKKHKKGGDDGSGSGSGSGSSASTSSSS